MDLSQSHCLSQICILIEPLSARLIRTEEQIEEEQNFIGKRILLAEDNDLNWEIAEEIAYRCRLRGRVGQRTADLCREVQGVRGRVL